MEKKLTRQIRIKKGAVILGILVVLVLSTYADYSYDNDKYYYEGSNKGSDYVLKVIKTEVNIPVFEKKLVEVQQDIDNYPEEKETCDDDVYAWWYMHNEEEFEIEKELEAKNPKHKRICKQDMITFYNYYLVDLPQKDVLIERGDQLEKEIKDMKDVYK